MATKERLVRCVGCDKIVPAMQNPPEEGEAYASTHPNPRGEKDKTTGKVRDCAGSEEPADWVDGEETLSSQDKTT